MSRARDEGERRLRLDLIYYFCRVNVGMTSAHNEMELVLMSDFLLQSPLHGAMIECGSYKGASACKLSHVARVTGRKLFVCDSFQGLPEPGDQDRAHHSYFGDEFTYIQGQYSASLEEVKNNLAAFGVPEACEFVPGFFSDTLPTLATGDLSFVFMDVDYISSARDCLQYLWPRLMPGGMFYTHEADVREFVYGITDSAWWHDVHGQCPPVLIGAGYGCGEDAGHLGFFEKRTS
ncbi:MAG: TylF/MycF family methyltransferase [Chloroflexota bacterium]|nr:TylF/MycF family methyltransferase [Chloroflexota bacterium]MDQ5865503.1 TylF/MycF family methyltransferase [Chloroflexota bacterium]